MQQKYEIKSKLWEYSGSASWHFITIPKEESDQIKFFAAGAKSAWGSVRVLVNIGSTSWKTSLFPDSKLGAYLLPVKSEVRRKENIKSGDEVKLTISLC